MLEIYEIYNNISNGYKYIEKLKIIQEVNKHNFKSALSNSIYFPREIQRYIESNLNQMMTYKAIINGKNIILNFYTNKNSGKDVIEKDIIHKTFVIIYVLSLYSSNRCSNNLTINIFLTPFKRMLPKKATDIIGSINVNGGLTYGGCRHTNDITIYREEEWFKVLIHELFHAFNLDFATMRIDKFKKRIATKMGIPCDYNVYESYCETWARILNVAMNSMTELTTKNEFLSEFNVMIKAEQFFSVIQCNKIYKRIKNLRSPLMYKENSNVICYYIFVGALMNNYEIFLKWCSNNNIALLKFDNTFKNVGSFSNLLLKQFNSKELRENLKIVDEIELGELKNSLKMTLM